MESNHVTKFKNVSKRRNRLGINPNLIALLSNLPPDDIPDQPTPGLLPGTYCKEIRKTMKRFPRETPVNSLELTCQTCGSTDNYNTGLLALDVEKHRKQGKHNHSPDSEPNTNILDCMQTTEYFRCHFCNDAGRWSLTHKTERALQKELFANLFRKIIHNNPGSQENIFFGKLAYAGGIVKARWATDAEEHYLAQLKKKPNDAYLWNRLGNVHVKGGRADLAAAVYEKSLAADPMQTESLFSLSKLLFYAGLDQVAKSYLRQVLTSAHRYEHLDNDKLRDLLASTLQMYIQVCPTLEECAESLPKAEEILSSNNLPIEHANQPYQHIEFEIDLDNPQTLYPLAEVYMGKRDNRKKELPGGKGARKKGKKNRIKKK